ARRVRSSKTPRRRARPSRARAGPPPTPRSRDSAAFLSSARPHGDRRDLGRRRRRTHAWTGRHAGRFERDDADVEGNVRAGGRRGHHAGPRGFAGRGAGKGGGPGAGGRNLVPPPASIGLPPPWGETRTRKRRPWSAGPRFKVTSATRGGACGAAGASAAAGTCAIPPAATPAPMVAEGICALKARVAGTAATGGPGAGT